MNAFAANEYKAKATDINIINICGLGLGLASSSLGLDIAGFVNITGCMYSTVELSALPRQKFTIEIRSNISLPCMVNNCVILILFIS
jgi:hypothetical protein